jgi:hypothetical protein
VIEVGEKSRREGCDEQSVLKMGSDDDEVMNGDGGKETGVSEDNDSNFELVNILVQSLWLFGNKLTHTCEDGATRKDWQQAALQLCWLGKQQRRPSD